MAVHPDSRLLAFLRDRSSYPHRPGELREVQTHASIVFLVPPLVYKIKKPVDFGFLDYSTLEKRRHCCQREVDLNARLAPGVYHGVVSVTETANGLAFGGDGPVVEYVVKMDYLAPEYFLDVRLKTGRLGEAEMERVASKLADFYRSQASRDEIGEWGQIDRLRISTDENFAQTEAFSEESISTAAFEAIKAFTDDCYVKRRRQFEKRIENGWIRDCHGDLHLDHIHVTTESLHIYDCIEFNDRLRFVDVASDLAFLAMDLDFHGRPDLSRFMIQRMEELLNDGEMGGVMDFYLCYRAYVRGKIECLRAVADDVGEREREMANGNARRYFQLALKYAVFGTAPKAVVIMGKVASGKSTLSDATSRELGWDVVSSDEVRKTLAGVSLCERLDEPQRKSLYAPAMTERTYARLIQEARERLDAGQGVILDATFSKRSARKQLIEALGEDRLKWVIVEVGRHVARERLRLRSEKTDVVSDARLEDWELLDSNYEPPTELPVTEVWTVDTEDDVANVMRRLLLDWVAAR
jgi:aminoglycoside phosphotransferase family enzyme/predicted kinase